MELVKEVKKAEEKSLNETRTRTTSGGMELAADSSGGVIDNESDGKEVTCLGMLETITTIVDCAEENRQLLEALEQILVPLALHIFQQLELPGRKWGFSYYVSSRSIRCSYSSTPSRTQNSMTRHSRCSGCSVRTTSHQPCGKCFLLSTIFTSKRLNQTISSWKVCLKQVYLLILLNLLDYLLD